MIDLEPGPIGGKGDSEGGPWKGGPRPGVERPDDGGPIPGMSRAGGGRAGPKALVLCRVVPIGVVTVIILSFKSAETSMRYPIGRKVLKP